MISNVRREPAGTGHILIPHTRFRFNRLLSFVPNFNSTKDENGFIDQSYLLFLKNIIVGLKNVSFKEKEQRRLYTNLVPRAARCR